MTTPTTAPEFFPLSRIVSLHTPRDSSARAPLLLVCTWMSAPPRLITKYTTLLASQFPRSRILLIRSTVTNFFFTPTPSFNALILPALEVLLTSDDVRMMIYSNGGGNSIVHLARLYRQSTGKPLYARGMVLDSAPGDPDIVPAQRAVLLSLPPAMLNGPVYYLLWISVWIMLLVLIYTTRGMGGQDPVTRAHQDLNDDELFGKGRRTYVYSETDVMVPFKGIERHATEAERRRWDVREEKFVGGKHVAHAVVDPERYWRVVRESLGAE